MLAINASNSKDFEEIFLQSVASAQFSHRRISLTLKETMSRKGHFIDDSNQYKLALDIIELPLNRKISLIPL